MQTRARAGAAAWSGEGFAEPSPRAYDAIMWPAEKLLLRRWRRRLYGAIAVGAGAGSGSPAGEPGDSDGGRAVLGARVLEIGAGTGSGFGFYPAGSSIVAVEPSVAMAVRARRRAARVVRAARGPAAIEVVEAWAEELPFADGSFEWAVATLTWCSVADPLAAFAEVRRVLRPSGRLLLLEHVHVRWQPARRLLSLAAPRWRRVAQGCRLDQDTVRLLRAAGFVVERRRDHLLGWVVELEARAADLPPITPGAPPQAPGTSPTLA